jgi:hypothetical protein
MSEIGTKVLEFEGAAVARQVVDGFNPMTNKWAFSFDSPFWKAIKHAHELGRKGIDRRVAIIDSGCDLTIQKLRQRVDIVKSFVSAAAHDDPLCHGTAVALLTTEVAPECRLDIYQVARDGKPDESAIVEALNTVAESNADIVNISIAALSPFQLTNKQLQTAITEGGGSIKKYALEEKPCGLCTAAMAASMKGKLVFAAGGNRPNTASCPARAEGIVAVGFADAVTKLTSLPNGGKQSAVFASGPSAPQSLMLDVSLREIPGVLGTSFAAPLFSGAAALGLTQSELSGYIAANAAAAVPQIFQGLIRSFVKPTPDMVKQVSRWFESAQKKLPHVHCTYQAEINPDAVASEPESCFSCGIFVEPIIVNHGLWLLETSRTNEAKSLLEAACTIAPWSADATANLGATMRELGDISGAIKLYELALKLRPDFRVYTSELKRLHKLMPNSGSRWWSRLWSGGQ